METTHHSFKDSQKEKWTEKFARFGIISKGIVYCLIGILTTMAALGLRGDKASKEDAFKLIYDQPLGKVLLLAVAIGLLGYVVWRFFQSVYDIDYKGNDTKGKFIRLGYAFSGLIYLALAIYAMRLSLNGPGSGQDSQQFIISKILTYPAGDWAIGIVALLTIGNGIRQLYKAISGKFMKNVRLTHTKHSDLFKKTGIAGYFSRGIVLIIIGYFFLRASLHHNASEAIGTEGAFSFIENAFGSILLGFVSLGLVGYGVFMFIKGRYQKMDFNF